jgi:hypothetical protein
MAQCLVMHRNNFTFYPFTDPALYIINLEGYSESWFRLNLRYVGLRQKFWKDALIGKHDDDDDDDV